MRNLSNPSIPFTFEDLELEQEEGLTSEFIALFPPTESQDAEKPAPETAEEQKLPEPPEDRSRREFEDAYAQGEKAGYEMGMRRVESIAKRLEKQIVEVVSFREELKARYERLSTELALIFTEALVLRTCMDQKDTLVAMIRKALEACEDRGEIVIRVRAQDVKYVEGLASNHLRIVADDTLKEPGFVIETNMGDIDGRIRTQIEELKDALVGYHDRE